MKPLDENWKPLGSIVSRVFNGMAERREGDQIKVAPEIMEKANRRLFLRECAQDGVTKSLVNVVEMKGEGTNV